MKRSWHYKEGSAVRLVHCNLKFEANIVWFLSELKNYRDRRLEVGFCPVCNKPVVRYTAVYKRNNRLLNVLVTKSKAVYLMHLFEPYILSTSNDIIPPSKLYGFRYGINKIIKKGKKQFLQQKASDFFGNTELVKPLQELKGWVSSH